MEDGITELNFVTEICSFRKANLDEVELPISIATLDLDGLLPGQSSLDGLHAVAVRCHDIRMHNRGGQSRLGYSQLAAVLAEDRGLKKGSYINETN